MRKPAPEGRQKLWPIVPRRAAAVCRLLELSRAPSSLTVLLIPRQSPFITGAIDALVIELIVEATA